MELYGFFSEVFPIYGIEFLAALSGLVYIKRAKTNKGDRMFVVFLWFVFFMELIAMYSPVAYYTDYEYFKFVEDTRFERNTWMYNISTIIGYVVYSVFLKYNTVNKSYVRAINILIVLFLITCLLNLLFSNIFFTKLSVFTQLTGTALLLFSVATYHLGLLQSDEILNFRKLLPFYISIGATVLSLCLVPFYIYGEFFKVSISIDFVQLQASTLLIVNLLVYSIYIFGFIVCLKKKSY